MHDSDLTRKSDPKYDDDLVNKRYVDNTINTINKETTNKFNNLYTFSTEEVKTGELWIDGRPIYRKGFTLSLVNDSNLSVNHNLGAVNFDKYWVDESASYIYGSSESLGVNWYHGSNDWARTWLNSTQIRFRSPSSLNGRTLYLVVKYTKTTD